MTDIKLLAVGDISLTTLNNRHPFQEVAGVLRNKDILFGNLETVLSHSSKAAQKAVTLYTAPENVSYLTDVGFDILSVANNHILDMDAAGCHETLDVLHQHCLKFIGVATQKYPQTYSILETNNTRIGFSGYYEYGATEANHDIVIKNIDDWIIDETKKLKLLCDIVIISLHWGIEYVYYPSPKQIRLARHLIDAGATIILGHHPHVIQGIEHYKNGLIAYSLGNFQFSSLRNINTDCRKSIILSIDITKQGLQKYEVIPVFIDEDFVPCIMDKLQTEEMLSHISHVSEPILRGGITEKFWFEEIALEHFQGNMKSWIKRIKKYGLKHLLQCVRWLFSPFILKCYAGMIRKGLKQAVRLF
jgi:poly-gamma-glutamate synthesis protein (capsule biosynthesis protein)